MISNHTSRSIDVIHGMAALGVIWGHSIQGSHYPLKLNGAFWVWIFLGISGYLVGKSFTLDRYGLTVGGYMRFAWNRALRIVPLYEIAIFIGLIFEIIGNKRDQPKRSSISNGFCKPIK